MIRYSLFTELTDYTLSDLGCRRVVALDQSTRDGDHGVRAGRGSGFAVRVPYPSYTLFPHEGPKVKYDLTPKA